MGNPVLPVKDFVVEMTAGLWGFDFGWSARDESIRTAAWGDPLGLRREVNDISTALVPVFRKRHRTADQFGLFCYALLVATDRSVDDFLAVERMWSLACARANRKWPGERRARQSLQTSHDHDLAKPLMANQVSTGLWGTNRRAAGMLGLTTPRPEAVRASPVEHQLTRPGRDMARTFREHFVESGRTVVAAVRRRNCTSSSLDAFITTNDAGSAALAEVMTAQLMLRPGDREMAESLARVFDLEAHLSISVLVRNRSLLTDGQSIAAARARSLLRVIHLVERPFRLWLSAVSDEPPDTRLWRHPAWRDVEWSPSARRVLEKGQSRPGWEGLELLARELARHRDEELPERGGFRKEWQRTPEEDFRLKAFASLLIDGLMPT